VVFVVYVEVITFPLPSLVALVAVEALPSKSPVNVVATISPVLGQATILVFLYTYPVSSALNSEGVAL
jgi:hypothetical protein